MTAAAGSERRHEKVHHRNHRRFDRRRPVRRNDDRPGTCGNRTDHRRHYCVDRKRPQLRGGTAGRDVRRLADGTGLRRNGEGTGSVVQRDMPGHGGCRPCDRGAEGAGTLPDRESRWQSHIRRSELRGRLPSRL